MPKTFGSAERYICNLFSIGNSFNYSGVTYAVEFVGNPTCSYGEPKTDIYVMASSFRSNREFKISFKKSNADFLENKMNSERARQLFGEE